VSTDLSGTSEPPLDPVRDPADRSILIGLIGTVLFHLLLAVFSPRFSFEEFSGIHTGISVNRTERGQTFDFELAQPAVPEERRQPFQFVDTNPEAPENEPDKTDNFSNRSQQSAQLDKPEELDPLHRAAIKDAQDKIKNDTAIVSGNLSQPDLGAAAQTERLTQDQAEQQEQKVRMEQVPLSGFDKTEGESEDGIATNVAKTQSPTTHAEQNVEGNREAKDLEGGLTAVTPSHKTQPKARPRLTAPRTTVLTNRAAGVANIGVSASDAFKSEYGEYLAELIEIVQVQWYHVLRESRVSPPRGTHVVVTFKLNAKGETDIVKVEDFDAGKQGVFSCQNAIQARQPYRKWTEQMIALLGEEQTLTFAFYYQ
jgi:hypothetical protein